MSRVPTDSQSIETEHVYGVSGTINIIPNGDGTYSLTGNGTNNTNKTITIYLSGGYLKEYYGITWILNNGSNELFNEIKSGSSVNIYGYGTTNGYCFISFPKTIPTNYSTSAAIYMQMDYSVSKTEYYSIFKVKHNGNAYEKIKLNGSIVTPK